jgi:hypothetical protein
MILHEQLDPKKLPWPFSERLRLLLAVKAADDKYQYAQAREDMTGMLAAELELEESRADYSNFDRDFREAVFMMVHLAAFQFPEALDHCHTSTEPIASIQKEIRKFAATVVRLLAETGVRP